MALIPHVYLDAGLTEQFDNSTDVLGGGAVNGSTFQGVFYFGDPDDTIKIQADSDPGVDPLTISIVDSTPGSGVEATHIKLATSQAGLSGATAGASLSVGDTVLGGTVNAVPVWYQWSNSTGAGLSTEISLSIVARVEVAV